MKIAYNFYCDKLGFVVNYKNSEYISLKVNYTRAKARGFLSFSCHT